MASIRQRGTKWQARILRDGYPAQNRTFPSRAQAEQWARAIEAQMDRGTFADIGEAQRTTLGDIVLRYVREVTPTMRSARDETIRLNALARRPIARYSIANLTASRVAEYRDERLQEVSPGTVIRDLAYLSAVINHARREWGINVQNPVTLVRKPPAPAGRSRVLSADERATLLTALEPTGRRSPWLKPIVVLALETAMRRGELLSLRWQHVHLKQQLAVLPTTKNGDSRLVPLSTAAVAVLESLPRSPGGFVFPMKACSVDAAFKRAMKRAGLVDFRFHDLRHTAITAMAEKLPNIIELSAVSGHRSLSLLKRYYHPAPSELARKLG